MNIIDQVLIIGMMENYRAMIYDATSDPKESGSKYVLLDHESRPVNPEHIYILSVYSPL